MNLDYIVRPKRDDNGKPYELHFLVDLESDRAYGYVETPNPDEVMFYVTTYESRSRHYLSLEAAKGFLEMCAIEQQKQECDELTKSVMTETEVVPVPVKAKVE